MYFVGSVFSPSVFVPSSKGPSSVHAEGKPRLKGFKHPVQQGNPSSCRAPPGWSSVVPVLAALLCFLCFLSGFSTLVDPGVLWRLLTFLGPSSVCERDVQK